MIARTRAAGASPGPLSVVPKNGIQLTFSKSQAATGRSAGTTTNNPHSPYTTLGIAASSSTTVRKTIAN